MIFEDGDYDFEFIENKHLGENIYADIITLNRVEFAFRKEGTIIYLSTGLPRGIADLPIIYVCEKLDNLLIALDPLLERFYKFFNQEIII